MTRAILVFMLSLSWQNLFAGWFCEDAASEKSGNIILTCGIGFGNTEALARKDALKSAFEELDTICEKSIDCKTMETLIEPQRNDCKKEGKKYKCYRAIQATITKTKRKVPFSREETNKPEKEKLDITIKIDPNDFIKFDDKKEPNKPKCAADLSALKVAMSDISTIEKQESMVQEAIKVPFDQLCSVVHMKIMSVLSRFKIKNDNYQAFLMKTLDGILEPADDERSYWILDYFKDVGPMDDKEWQVALESVSRTKDRSLYRVMPRLFNDHAVKAKQRAVEKKRLDTLVQRIKNKQIGRPMPIEFDYGFEQILRSVASYKSRENPWLALYAIEKYQKDLKRSSPEKIHRSLRKLYGDTQYPEAKAQINTAIAQNIAKSPPSYKFSKPIVDYLQSFAQEIKKLDDEEDEDIAKIKMYQQLRKDFIKLSGAKLIANINTTERDFEIKSRSHLCLELQLPCQELIPDLKRLRKLLTSKKSGKRLDALETIAKMPKAAKDLEKEITAVLNEAVRGKIDNANSLIKSSAIVLSTIPTKNKDTLKLLSELILRSRLHTQYIREGVGKYLEPFWVEELKKTHTTNHNRVILELKEYDSLSKPTCTYLKSRNNPKDAYFIKDGIKALLDICAN